MSVVVIAALACQLTQPVCQPDEKLFVDPMGQCWCATNPGQGGPNRSAPGASTSPGTGSVDPGLGNPGNDKNVGRAGERPSGRGDWGGGSRGRSDGDRGSKGGGKGKSK